MVRATLVVSVAPHSRAHSRGLVGVVPAASATTADGGRSGESESHGAESTAGRTAALVRNALVVSARGHRDNSALDHADDTDDPRRYDAPPPADAARLDATPAGHVFCLTALMMDARRHVRRRSPWCRARRTQ